MLALFSSRYNLIFSVLLLVALFTSLIVLGIDGHLVSGGTAEGAWAFLIFACVWTWITVIPALAFAIVKPDFLLLQSRFMLATIGLNWVFWLAGAAAVTDKANAYINYFCGSNSGYFGRFTSYAGSNCSEVRALLAFAWITWLLFLAAFGGLLTLSSIEASKRNNDVWSTSVYDYPFGSTVAKSQAARPEMASSTVGATPTATGAATTATPQVAATPVANPATTAAPAATTV